jgi:hypothetical protein
MKSFDTFNAFLTEEENHLIGLKPGQNAAHVYHGKEDTAKVYRHPKGHYVMASHRRRCQ